MKLLIFVALCATLLPGVVAIAADGDKDSEQSLLPRRTPGKDCAEFPDCQGCVTSHFCVWSEANTKCLEERKAVPADKACHKCKKTEEEKKEEEEEKKKEEEAAKPKMEVACCDENEKSLHQVVTASVKGDLGGIVSGEAVSIVKKEPVFKNYTAPEYYKVWMTEAEAKEAREKAEKQAWALRGQVQTKKLPVAETWQRYEMRRQIEIADEDRARAREDPSSVVVGHVQGDDQPEHPVVVADPLPDPDKPEVAPGANATDDTTTDESKPAADATKTEGNTTDSAPAADATKTEGNTTDSAPAADATKTEGTTTTTTKATVGTDGVKATTGEILTGGNSTLDSANRTTNSLDSLDSLGSIDDPAFQ